MRYTVGAVVREEGAIGSFYGKKFDLELATPSERESDQRSEIISKLREAGFETNAVLMVEPSISD